MYLGSLTKKKSVFFLAVAPEKSKYDDTGHTQSPGKYSGELNMWCYEKLDFCEKSFAKRLLEDQRRTGAIILTHNSGRVTQICVFNTVKLGTSASSP